MTMRGIAELNSRGHQTIIWDEDGDEHVLPVIEKKLAEGVAFFILEPRFFGLLPSKRTPLTSVEEAKKHRVLSVADEDFAKFVGDGHGELAQSQPDASEARRSRDAKEIASSTSIAVKPKRGG